MERVDAERGKLLALKEQSDRKVDQMAQEIKMMKDQARQRSCKFMRENNWKFEQKMALSRRIKDEQTGWKKFQEDQKKEMLRLKIKLKSSEHKYQQLENEIARKSTSVSSIAIVMTYLTITIAIPVDGISTRPKSQSQAPLHELQSTSRWRGTNA